MLVSSSTNSAVRPFVSLAQRISVGTLVAVACAAPAYAQRTEDFFGSSDCCPTQECQAERYREVSRQRYEYAQGCVAARAAPCPVQPPLDIVPLCAVPRRPDEPSTLQPPGLVLEGGVEI